MPANQFCRDINDLYGHGRYGSCSPPPGPYGRDKGFMGTATIQVRVLAVAGLRVWVAATGTLDGPTLRVLHYCLCARVADDRTQLFLDLKETCWDEALSPDELPGLLPAGSRLRFDIVGAHERVRAALGGDLRCHFHPDIASAWAVWARQP